MNLPSREWVLGASAVAAALVGSSLYYSTKVRANADYLTQRNYRLLSTAGRQLQELTRTAGRMANRDIRTACQTALDETAAPGRPVDSKKRGRSTSDVHPCQQLISRSDQGDSKPIAGKKIQDTLDAGLRERRSTVRWGRESREAPSIEFEEYRLHIGPRPGTRGCPAAVAYGRAPGKREATGSLTRVDEYHGARCVLSVETRVRVNLDSLFSPFLAVFDVVAVLDEKRRPLAAIPSERPLGAVLADRPVGEKLPGGEPAGDATEAGASPDPAVPQRVEITTLADRRYVTFCRPLSGERTTSPSLLGWTSGSMVCGLVQVDRFHTEKVALNPYWLVAFGSFLALGMLSWPLLNVLYLGQAERLRLYDLLFLALALVASTSLVTLLVLDLTSYLTVERVASGERVPAAGACAEGDASAPRRPQDLASQLQSLTTCVAGNVETELRDLREMLFSFQKLPVAAMRADLGEAVADITPRLPGILGSSAPYPFFKNVVWMDETGRQRVKWSAEGRRTDLLNVSDRSYFRKVVGDQLWTVEGDEKRRFYLEPVQSRNTGEFNVVLSAQTSPLEGDPKATWAIALSARPVSLISPVLPAGFGFALIAPGGETVFHAGRDHLAEENFFEECDRNPRLLAAVLSRTSDVFAARYWGRDHLLSVSPLHELPLVLVTFVEKDLVRTVHLELLSLCLIAVVTLLIIVAFYGVLARAVTGQGGERWLWPRSDATPRYAALAALFLVIGLELVRSASATSGTALRVLTTFSFPLAVVGLIASILGRWRPGGRRYAAAGVLVGLPLATVAVAALVEDDPRKALGSVLLLAAALALLRWPDVARAGWMDRPSATRRAYIAWAAASLFAIAVAPAYAFFRVAWERQARLFVQYGQLDLARRLDERERSLPPIEAGAPDAEGKRSGRCRPGRIGIEGNCAERGYDAVYAAPFFQTVVRDLDPETAPACSPNSGHGPGWLDSLAGGLPFYNTVSVRLRGMTRSCAGDGEWRAKVDPGKERFTLLVRRASRRQAYEVASVIPRFRVLSHPAPWVAFAGLTVGVVGLLGFLVRRFFLLDFRAPETVCLEGLAGSPLATHLLVLCPPLACKRKIRSRPDVFVVDLGATDPLTALSAAPPEARALCFDRFELALADPATRRALLLVLESLVDAAARPVVILSEQEPEDFLAADEGRRWSRLLGHFARIVAVDSGDMLGFKAALRAVAHDAGARWAGRPDAPVRRARLAGLLATVYQECRHHRQLQSIGRTLVELPDFAEYETERLVRHLRERAHGFYRALWISLPSCEKLLLTRVASGHLVNPRCGRVLSRLLARKLLVPGAGFRIVNRSFARFIMSEARPEEIAAWERAAAVSLWSQMRLPVMISLAGAAGFLAFMQGDTLSSSLAALGASVPLLVRVLDFMRSAPALDAASTVERANG